MWPPIRVYTNSVSVYWFFKGGKKPHAEIVLHAFCGLLIFFINKLFRKIISRIPLEFHTVLTQIRLDILSGLIWVKTVCKDYQHMIKIVKAVGSPESSPPAAPSSSSSSSDESDSSQT